MEFLSIFNSIGTAPLILLVLVILFFMIKETRAGQARMEESFKDSEDELKKKISLFRDELRAEIADIRAQQEKKDKAQDEMIAQVADRLLNVEQNYAKKMDIQEAVGGWRMEINKLGERIDLLLVAGGKKGGRD